MSDTFFARQINPADAFGAADLKRYAEQMEAL